MKLSVAQLSEPRLFHHSSGVFPAVPYSDPLLAVQEVLYRTEELVD